jgi:hypothetical protein
MIQKKTNNRTKEKTIGKEDPIIKEKSNSMMKVEDEPTGREKMKNNHVEDEYRVKEKLNAKMKEGLNNEVK